MGSASERARTDLDTILASSVCLCVFVFVCVCTRTCVYVCHPYLATISSSSLSPPLLNAADTTC